MKVNIAKRKEVMERSIKLGHCICDPRRPCPCDVFRDQGICPCAGERPDPADLPELRLTRLVRNAGCASKISPADLDSVLGRLPEVVDASVISGLAAADDAAIYRISDDLNLVQTVDVFTPCVDDPFVFGRICAANCLSDIYATGGRPRTALSVLAFPSEKLPGEIMYQMLAGAMQTLAECGVALVGGHSIKDEEIKLGFAITGTIDLKAAESLERATAGDVLVLTKPLGTGVICFCAQIDRADTEGIAAASESMARTNREAAEAMLAAGASACTDITGFGLLGHLLRLGKQSQLSARIYANSLPALPGVTEALRDGVIPGGIERNREYVGDALTVGEGVVQAQVQLACDPQTSGGLLIAVPPARLPKLLTELQNRRITGYPVGEFLPGPQTRILFTQDQKPDFHTMKQTSTSSEPAPAHDAGCCAEFFPGQPAPSIEPTDSQRAFAAFIRSVQAPGTLNVKTKELILLALVIQSRCRPCLQAHLERAAELGITEAEIEEAAWCAIAMGGAPVKMFYQDHAKRRVS